ncbi:MAG: helix-turn-helix transcriptional regulator [Colwellia sp.]|nr:helix-turn-helix transcriptional regulator [Colwellia sp.]
MAKLHTENEIVTNNSKQIYYFAKLLETQPDIFYQVAEHLPFIIFQSERNSLNWRWGNQLGLDVFEIEPGNAPDIFQLEKKANKAVLAHSITKIKSFSEENDKHSLCSYYQLYDVENEQQWVASSKMITGDNEFFSISYLLKDFSEFGAYIHKMLDTTLADVNAWRRFQSLSKQEKNILQLLGNGMTSKEIAILYNISNHTVRTHRRNIYEKINVKNLHDLIRFADAFQLIGAY